MFVLQVTGGSTWVQCSLQILLYFVADRHSGPGERLLYPKLQTNTMGYSVVDRSLYTLFPTDIPVYSLGDRPLYPGLLTDAPMYSVAYRSWFTLSLTYIPVYSPCDRPLYPGLLTDTLDNNVADSPASILHKSIAGRYRPAIDLRRMLAGRSVYFVAYSGIFITVSYQQTINLDPVTLSRTYDILFMLRIMYANQSISDKKFFNTMLDYMFIF